MTEGTNIIDVWDFETFDTELRGELDAHTDVIRDCMLTSRRQWLESEASNHTMHYPENPYAGEFIRVKEHIMRLMEVRTIRAWHYTRLTDAEVGALRQGGIYPSSLDTIRSRLTAQVSAGAFGPEVADRVFSDSPYQSDQRISRSDKFWMHSHPVEVEDCGVASFLKYWGGESTYFFQRDAVIQDMLKRIGRPRVLEIAMPLAYSHHGYWAAQAVVTTYGRFLGCLSDKHAFDLYTHQPLGPEHVLAVHSEGEPNFGAMARGYPAGFVDVNLELWGEE